MEFFPFFDTSHNSLQYCLCLFSPCYVGHRQTCLLLKSHCMLLSAVRTSHTAADPPAPYLAADHDCYFFQLMRCAKTCIFLHSCTVVTGIQELEGRLWKLQMDGKKQAVSHFPASAIAEVPLKGSSPKPASLFAQGRVGPTACTACYLQRAASPAAPACELLCIAPPCCSRCPNSALVAGWSS